MIRVDTDTPKCTTGRQNLPQTEGSGSGEVKGHDAEVDSANTVPQIVILDPCDNSNNVTRSAFRFPMVQQLARNEAERLWGIAKYR